MGLPGSIVEEPMTEFMSTVLSSRALRRSGGIGSGGGGAGSGRVANQMPTPQTATTNTSATAAMIGHGFRLGLTGWWPWFQGTEPENCCGTGMLGGGPPQLPPVWYCGVGTGPLLGAQGCPVCAAAGIGPELG